MKKSTINFWLDAAVFLVLLSTIWTGLLIHFVLPAGQSRGRNWLLWGLDRHDYGNIHFYLAVAMGVLVFIHLWLHWSWICSIFCNLFKRSVPQGKTQILWGLGLLLMVCVVCAASLFWAHSLVIKR